RAGPGDTDPLARIGCASAAAAAGESAPLRPSALPAVGLSAAVGGGLDEQPGFDALERDLGLVCAGRLAAPKEGLQVGLASFVSLTRRRLGEFWGLVHRPPPQVR